MSQEAANKELFRRANSGEDQNQDRFRPWRLPKGNFYHRILTTGNDKYWSVAFGRNTASDLGAKNTKL